MSSQPRRQILTLGIGALIALSIVPFFMRPASAERPQGSHVTRVISLAELEKDSVTGSYLRTMGAGGASLALMFPAPAADPPPERVRPDRFSAQVRSEERTAR
jgi:hypothetical protein